MRYFACAHDGADFSYHLLKCLFLACAVVLALPTAVISHPIEIIYEGESGQLDLSSVPDFLPRTQFETTTVWTDASDLYEGVLLRDLLTHLDVDLSASGGRVIVEALDGYSAEIEFGQISDEAPLLAFLRNGKPMPRRAQGPYWLIFPYDHDPQYRTESIYAQSVWQVTRLTISY